MACLIHGQIIVEPLVSSNIVKFIMTVFKDCQFYSDNKLACFVFTAQFLEVGL